MKTVLLYACALFFISCQKEVIIPKSVKETPHVVIPEPEPEPAPEPEPEPNTDTIPDPPPGEISETVYLRNLPAVFNSQNHYKLVKIYTDQVDMWDKTPTWAKDDIHIFNDMGSGSIESVGESCPENPFSVIQQNWSAYIDDMGVRLTWVDTKYKPATFVLVKANAGVSFKAYQVVDGTKIYFEYQVVSTIK